MRICILLCIILTACFTACAIAQDDDAGAQAADQAALAKASQNPVANMISIPTEFWYGEGENGDSFTFAVKPVIPTPVGGLNLINRFILPYASVNGTLRVGLPTDNPLVVDASGLTDFTYQGFLSPAKPGALIWGAGAALTVPTATEDQLGTNRWSAGPSILGLTMPGKWVLGLLAQNIWDFAGSGDESVNIMTLQPILSYALKNGWYLTSIPIITANWEAESDDVWKVPLGGGVGKVQKFGKLPVDIKLAYYNYVVKPTYGTDWSVMLGIKFILPK